MTGNKQAYDAAFQRAVAGKSSNSLWGFITTALEDEYTRRSRQDGERDGAAARKHAGESPAEIELPTPGV